MAWIWKHLLISEGGIRTAALLRLFLALIVVVLSITACRQNWGGASASYALTVLNAVSLFQFSLLSLRWKRERGLWMLYALLAALSVIAYALCAMIPYGQPAPSATPAFTAGANADAAFGAWLCFMNVRLQVSAAVANTRRFRAGSAELMPVAR